MTDNLPTLEIEELAASGRDPGVSGVCALAREVLALRSQLGPHNKLCECDSCIPELAGVGRTFKEYAQELVTLRSKLAAAEKMAEALDGEICSVPCAPTCCGKLRAALAQWKEAAK